MVSLRSLPELRIYHNTVAKTVACLVDSFISFLFISFLVLSSPERNLYFLQIILLAFRPVLVRVCFDFVSIKLSGSVDD